MASFDAKIFIDKFTKESKNGKSDPLIVSTRMLDDAFALALNSLRDKNISPELVAIAVHNFLINTVSSLEILYRNLILQIDNWDADGLKSLLSDKISLNEAYELFHSVKVNREYLIANHYKFQNFDIICSTFSKLAGVKDFYREVEEYKFKYSEPNSDHVFSLIELFPSWRKTVSSIYNSRNEYVHEGKISVVVKGHHFDVYTTVLTFMIVVTGYLENKFQSKGDIDLKRLNPK